MKTLLIILFCLTSGIVSGCEEKQDTSKTETLDLMQGMWFNTTREDIQNYTFIKDNRSMGISLSNSNELIDLTMLVVGFINVSSSKELNRITTIDVTELKRSGKYFVWSLEKHVRENKVSKPGFNIVTGFYCDGIMMIDGANEPSEYKKITYLPYYVYHAIQQKGIKDKADYIKAFGISPTKVQVITDKTFFYSQPSENQKRAAFLIKNDIAYVNTVTKNWIEVEFHGKTISKGWIKTSDLKILD